MQGLRVWSLVGDLKSHVPHGQKKQNIRQKQYCNKFNKDFQKKKVHIKKKKNNQKNKKKPPQKIPLHTLVK